MAKQKLVFSENPRQNIQNKVKGCSKSGKDVKSTFAYSFTAIAKV